MTRPTPSQTVGPFFHIGLSSEGLSELVPPDAPGAIRIVGTVSDGEGEPVTDALLEVWQADPAGRYAHPEDGRDEPAPQEGFTGFGRCETDEEGRYGFVTVKPGPLPAPGGGTQAPHIDVSLFARGLLKRLVTRIYFSDEEQANREDPVLSEIEDPEQRSTLLAIAQDGGYGFDIHLQGERETAFLDV